MASSVLYLAVTTGRYHETRVRAILETWGSEVSDRVFFLSDAPWSSDRVIDLQVPADYESASLKLLAGLGWAHARFRDSFDWFFVCDDDTFVYTENVEAFLQSKNPGARTCYCQMLQHYPALPDLTYPSGGAGFAMSRATLKTLIPAFEGCAYHPFTDVTIGVCMREVGIDVIDIPGFYSQPPKKVEENRGSGEFLPTPYTFHYITPEMMHQLYDERESMAKVPGLLS